MSALAKGWCPGAHRPMMSGDGLVVRVRPRLGRLTAAQVLGLAEAAERFGNGIIELTRRANLQLRGVRDHGGLLGALERLGLLDGDAATEERRNILVAPLWAPGDPTARLAETLESRLGDLPDLPAKFGFAVDCGAGRMLAEASADVRIERGRDGLVVRADGAGTGRAVEEGEAVARCLDLAAWFAGMRGDGTRMAQVVAAGALPATWQGAPVAGTSALALGESAAGPVVGVAFGQITARALREVAEASGARAVRLTPWRRLILEGGRRVAHDALILDKDDPLLGVDACPGAPACASATVETRALARALAGRVAGGLHVSGCAKGCARSGAAAVTLVGRDGGFDLVWNGRASDAPVRQGLTPGQVLEVELG